jgi:starch synthase (maltosyl-transferring)
MKSYAGRRRVIIEKLQPELDHGRFAAKRVVGEEVVFGADIFTDGHDLIQARLLIRRVGSKDWIAMALRSRPNDL